MALRANDLAARDAGRINFRAEPMRVRVELANLISADRHEIVGSFDFSAQVGDQASDRQLFAEVLMADRALATREDVALHLRSALEAAASAAVAQPVSNVLSDTGKREIEKTLRKAADAAAFNLGLIVLPPFQLELASPSLQRQQREAAMRLRVEEQAAGRLDHLRRATELLKQFDSLRAAAPSVSAGQVLERIAPADRGSLLEALLASSADRSNQRTLYAVAGSDLVRIDPLAEPLQPVLIPLPTTLGPLRSVVPATIDGQTRLLIGARSGVLMVDPREPAAAIAYAVPDLNSSLGFNRAVYAVASNALFATHGEAGLVRWERDTPASPSRKIRPADLTPQANGPVRNIHALGGDAIACSIGNSIALVQGNEKRLVPCDDHATIVSIVPASDRLFVIHENGAVATLDRASLQITRRDTYGGAVCAAGALPWLDGLRLLLACTSGPVDCVGPDDSLVTRYNSVYRGLRDIAASAGCVAAVSPDRQRLILWNSWDGRAPAHDVHLISLTRHRIGDIAFA